MIYDASKLGTVYVVKSPVLGLQKAFFQKSLFFFSKLKINLEILFVKKMEIINKLIKKYFGWLSPFIIGL